MTEKVVIGNATLWLGDCMEVLPTLPKMDAVITDPPYGVEKASWDEVFPAAAFWSLVADRLLGGGSALVFPGEADAPSKLATMAAVLNYQWVLVWYAPNAMQFGKTGFTKKSLVWWFAKGKPVVRPRMPDLYECAIVPGANDFGHPSPKPLNVMTPLMEFAAPGAVVLDPFMGSGTTGVACAMTGRGFVGIEKEPRYFDIACRRIEQAQAQGALFEPEPPRAEQMSIDA